MDVGRTTQRLADRIKQHVPTSIRKKINIVREQLPRVGKNNNLKRTCDSAIGQHLITNPECAKTYINDNFRIIGQARSSFHLIILKSFYIKTQNSLLFKQKEFIFSLGFFKYTVVNRYPLANHRASWTQYSSYHAYPDLAKHLLEKYCIILQTIATSSGHGPSPENLHSKCISL